MLSQSTMGTRLQKQSGETEAAVADLAKENAHLEELFIRQQAVNAGMTQDDSGQVTTLAEQLMQAQRDAQQCDTGV